MTTVRFTKWGGTLHWHFELERLGEDEHGVWLGAPVGTRMQRGSEPPITEQSGCVQLVPRAGGWAALWNRTRDVEIYVDIASEPVWSDDGSVVTLVDLDLDVVRWRDGRVEILDEDEFAEHQVALGYPAAVIAAAEATTAEMVRALTERIEPFDTVGPSWLGRLR